MDHPASASTPGHEFITTRPLRVKCLERDRIDSIARSGRRSAASDVPLRNCDARPFPLNETPGIIRTIGEQPWKEPGTSVSSTTFGRWLGGGAAVDSITFWRGATDAYRDLYSSGVLQVLC